MDFTLAERTGSKRATALAVTVALHIAIVLVLMASRPAADKIPEGRSMEVWFVTDKPAAREPVPVPPRTAWAAAHAKPPARRQTPKSPPPAPAVSIADAPRAAESTVMEVQPAASPTPSAQDMLRQARKEIGGIDRDMRKQIPRGLVRAPVMTPQKRLEQGIALANEMAPPKWYEAPKITEVIDPGGWGKKRYRVVTANGTYCLTYESNRPTGGNDLFAKARQTRTNCEPNELPPTTQP